MPRLVTSQAPAGRMALVAIRRQNRKADCTVVHIYSFRRAQSTLQALAPLPPTPLAGLGLAPNL
jgi:hypothetical protein